MPRTGKFGCLAGCRMGNNSKPKGLVEEYDVATDKWTKKKQMPLPAHHLAVTEYKGKIYVFGGGAQLEPNGPNWVPINNAWEYTPETDTWKALAPMPTARGAAVAAQVNGKIYVIGGASVHPGQKIVGLSAQTPHRALGTNEMYDPETNTWTKKSPMPTSRNHAAIGVVNGKIYVLGGRLGAVFVNASPTDVVEEYDPATDLWGYAMAKMPHGAQRNRVRQLQRQDLCGRRRISRQRDRRHLSQLRCIRSGEERMDRVAATGDSAPRFGGWRDRTTTSTSSAGTCSRGIFTAIRWTRTRTTRLILSGK